LGTGGTTFTYQNSEDATSSDETNVTTNPSCNGATYVCTSGTGVA
jgi:hypothetical protein